MRLVGLSAMAVRSALGATVASVPPGRRGSRTSTRAFARCGPRSGRVLCGPELPGYVGRTITSAEKDMVDVYRYHLADIATPRW